MSKIDYNELVEFVRTHDEYYVAEFMLADNKRIAELEQELAELKERRLIDQNLNILKNIGILRTIHIVITNYKYLMVKLWR